jgi:hypothetical protein
MAYFFTALTAAFLATLAFAGAGAAAFFALPQVAPRS